MSGDSGVLAAITDPDVARRILMCLRLPPRPLAPAISSKPAADSWVGAPESWDFDQTVAEDWDSGARETGEGVETDSAPKCPTEPRQALRRPGSQRRLLGGFLLRQRECLLASARALLVLAISNLLLALATGHGHLREF